MSKEKEIPKTIYKYRGFTDRLLDMLVNDELYYSNPGDFNDPLDCRPSLEADLTDEELEQVLSSLMEDRILAEMQSATFSLKLEESRAVFDHALKKCQEKVVKTLEEARYHVRQNIEKELFQQYDRGIVSFGECETCPLMWSHYGDQHNGICVGYSVPPEARSEVHKVSYGGSRKVLASDVAKMNFDDAARRRVDDAVLLRKAESWHYEREWRLIGERGVRASPLELEEVIFGIRCKDAVRFTIVRALENRERSVRFFEIREEPGTFNLQKCDLDTKKLTASLPRRSGLNPEDSKFFEYFRAFIKRVVNY